MQHRNSRTGGLALRSDAYFVSRARRGRPAVAGAAALAALTLTLAAPAQAQQQQQQQLVLEEIQVTGSRIERTGFTTPVPVTSMDRDELRAMEPASTLAEQLDQLPQFFMTESAQRGGGTLFGSAGGSFLNMRGVGRERTLVLLDGHRVVPSDRWSSVNVDYFPSALIQRVEVVTGGASAAYGADALAGVTNFILDRQFSGFQSSVQGGMAEFGDGHNWQAEAAFGTSLTDRLHVIGSIEARQVDQIRRAALPRNADAVRWHQDWGYVSDPDGDGWLTMPFVHSTQHTPTGLIREPGFAFDRHTFTDDGRDTRPFQLGDYATVVGGQGNQSGGSEYYNARIGGGPALGLNEVKQRSGFLGFDYELNDRANLWGHGILGRVESNSYNSHTFQEHWGIWHMTMFRDNPYLPDHVNEAMHQEDFESVRVHRNGGWIVPIAEAANRHDMDRHGMASLTLGGDFELGGGWNLRAAYQYGESQKKTDGRNWQRIDRTHLAFDAVRDPETGGIVCRIQVVARELEAQGRDLAEELHEWALANTNVGRHDAGRDPSGAPSPVDYPIAIDEIDNSIRDCVPLNPLGLGNSDINALHYIQDDKLGRSSVKQHFAEVLVTGTLHEGWGAGSIEQALGVTYRDESVWQGVADQSLAIDALGPPFNVTLDDGTVVVRGIPSGFEGGSPNMHRFSTIPAFSGSFDVWEVFSETIVPLYTSASGEQRVEANIAARFAEYSRAGGVWTYKGGLDFQVTNDLRLRGTWSRDFREGSFSEQFDLQGGGGNINDPAFGYEQFEITSVAGGNPDIEPETADTLVAGFIYQPSFLDGLQVSADWYDIRLKSAIGQPGLQRVVEECHYNGIWCEYVEHRFDEGRDTDVIARVWNPFLNIDAARVRGFDIEAAYRFTPNLFADQSESLSVRALAGYQRENSNTPLDAPKADFAGTLGRPKWQSTGTVTYNVGPVSVRAQQRYIHSQYRFRPGTGEAGLVDNNRVPSATYTNLGLSYSRDTSGGGEWTTFLNINNLFDRDPPIIPSFGQRGVGAQTSNAMFDLLGRRYTAGLRYRY